MSKKLPLTELKKKLKQKTKNELVEEITYLFKTFDNVKEYYQMSLNSDDSAVLKKYKRIVEDEFIPATPLSLPQLRISVARKAISDYRKVAKSKFGIADIMLTYVEAGVHCTNEFGDIDEPFYNSMESMYARALKYMVKEDLFHDFEPRIKAILRDTRHCGWGFYDGLSEIYEEYSAKVSTTIGSDEK